MKRISTPTRSINLFGAGKDGFKNGDLATGVQPTNLDAGWFNQMQEEVAQIIEGAGIEINENYNTQLLQAVRRMSGGNVRTVAAGHTVLTVDDAGLVIVDATLGAVTIALPRANVLKALPFTFRRIDSTANLVTVSVAGIGGDVIDGEATSFELTGNQAKNLVSDGAGVWYSDIVGITQAQGDVRYALASDLLGYVTAAQFTGANQSLTANGYQKIPGGGILQWGRVAVSVTSIGGVVTFSMPITFPNNFFSITGSLDNSVLVAGNSAVYAHVVNNSQATIVVDAASGSEGLSGTVFVNYVAIGN